MNTDTLNIFFVVDENYIIPFTVTLTSILENNKDLDIEVYVLHKIDNNELLQVATEFFKNSYNTELITLRVDNSAFQDFYTSHHISITTYNKLLLGELLPKNVKRGLYIDCDIIVTGSFKKLLGHNFFDNKKNSAISLYAVQDKRAGREVNRIGQMGVKIDGYFNSGVLLIDLNRIREKISPDKVMEVVNSFGEKLTYHDQDIFNILLKDDYGDLEETFNRDASVKYENLPVVLHYFGISKPWQFIDNGPNKSVYKHYFELTPFKDLKLEKITLEKVGRKYVRLLKGKMGLRETP